MNCKNCGNTLENDALFCEHCGAKVIKDRITFKHLLQELFASFGWDSLYFSTLKKMILKPQEVLNEYLDGTRKKYVNPFAYLAVGSALSLLLFSSFTEDFIDINNSMNKEKSEQLKTLANEDLTKYKETVTKKEFKKLQNKKKSAQFAVKYQNAFYSFFVNYFNIVSFLIIPLYALMSKFTFRKPHNYGEHIIMNCYLQGTTMYFSMLFFLLALLINPKIYIFSTFTFVAYYLYAYKQLYCLSLKQLFLKLLRFFIVAIIIILIIALIVGAFTLIAGIIMGYNNPSMLKP
ncbi:DUF3667 domain-containing protein [Tenacibaculum amylolyticum]|uniref:DUF3667 domain-containing protein n=1 Tax=Tenacibaculum amylolyticum TaxID=104269 RepID=UPI003893DC01